jgi:predicted acylesterase/phospholipase RssA
MPREPTKQVEIGVVLQGGGALGAYECGGMGALLELMDQAAASGHTPTLRAVSGVSIGAINAACVVGAKDRADARRRLNGLWDDLTLHAPEFWPRQAQRDLSLFGLPGFYLPRFDLVGFGTWTAYYNTRPLLRTLERHVDFAALNASATTFVCTAVDVESGELKRFSNHALGDDRPTAIDPKHVMASGSLPPQFPWTELNERIYWDGGLVDNAPLGDAIDAFSDDDRVARMLVVLNLYPLQAQRPRTLADVEDRLHELSFGNRMRQDRKAAERINDLVATIEELAPLVPSNKLTKALQGRVRRASQFKLIEVVNIDVQDPAPAGGQHPADDQYGLRDFSRATVNGRRERGYAIAHRSLSAAFAKFGLLATPKGARRAKAPSRG